MNSKSNSLALVLIALLVLATNSCPADSFPLTRRFDRTVALTNSPILATVTFTNGGTNTLRGYFYGEQIPSALTLSPVAVRLNGRTVTNFVLDTGQDGDVYAGFTPVRWRLETPTNFTETNLVTPQAGVQITYSLKASLPGDYSFQQFDWAGYTPIGTNSAFGYSQVADQQVIHVLATNVTSPSLSARRATDSVIITLTGTAGVSYVLDTSADFSNWTPLITNTPSFSFSPTNAALTTVPAFYRGRIFFGGP